MNTGQNCYYFGFSDIFDRFMLVLPKLYCIIFMYHYSTLVKYVYFVYFYISRRFLSVISSSIRFHATAPSPHSSRISPNIFSKSLNFPCSRATVYLSDSASICIRRIGLNSNSIQTIDPDTGSYFCIVGDSFARNPSITVYRYKPKVRACDNTQIGLY